MQVELHTANALTYGLRITEEPFGNFATDPLIFGARAQDVLYDDATPGIGECHASLAWLFRTRFQGATADAFPAEFVEVRGTGK